MYVCIYACIYIYVYICIYIYIYNMVVRKLTKCLHRVVSWNATPTNVSSHTWMSHVTHIGGQKAHEPPWLRRAQCVRGQPCCWGNSRQGVPAWVALPQGHLGYVHVCVCKCVCMCLFVCLPQGYLVHVHLFKWIYLCIKCRFAWGSSCYIGQARRNMGKMGFVGIQPYYLYSAHIHTTWKYGWGDVIFVPILLENIGKMLFFVWKMLFGGVLTILPVLSTYPYYGVATVSRID